MNENEIMDIRTCNPMKLAIHLRPIKNRTPIWKDRMEDGRTDKEKTKRHARSGWKLAVFSVAHRRKAQNSDESKLSMKRAPGHNLFYRFTRVEMCRQHLLDKQLDVPSRIPFGNGERDPQTVAVYLTITTCTVKIYIYI